VVLSAIRGGKLLSDSLLLGMLALPCSYMADFVLYTAVSKQDDVCVNKQTKIYFFLINVSKPTHVFSLGK